MASTLVSSNISFFTTNLLMGFARITISRPDARSPVIDVASTAIENEKRTLFEYLNKAGPPCVHELPDFRPALFHIAPGHRLCDSKLLFGPQRIVILPDRWTYRKARKQRGDFAMNGRVIAGCVALLLAILASANAQVPATQSDATLPEPGARGNADNVPFIGQRDPGGNPVRLAKATGHVSNYNEEKVPPYTLPDPLVMNDGRAVTTAQMWFNERRPEILKFYQTQIYGRIPENAPKMTWEEMETKLDSGIARTSGSNESGAPNGAIVKTIVGHMGDKSDGPAMKVTLYLPPEAKQPVPVLLSISFGFVPGGRGGQGRAQTAGSGKAEGNEAAKAAPARGPAAGFNSLGEVLGRGWAYASLNYGDIQPDRANAWNQGVVSLTLKEGQTQPAADEWGTISAWAWGISRAIDYLETNPAVNSKQVAITGASRLGKTVLWAGAQDQRVAAVFSVVSGEMGAALIRRDWGETLDDMAQNFSWQFAGNLQ